LNSKCEVSIKFFGWLDNWYETRPGERPSFDLLNCRL